MVERVLRLEDRRWEVEDGRWKRDDGSLEILRKHLKKSVQSVGNKILDKLEAR